MLGVILIKITYLTHPKEFTFCCYSVAMRQVILIIKWTQNRWYCFAKAICRCEALKRYWGCLRAVTSEFSYKNSMCLSQVLILSTCIEKVQWYCRVVLPRKGYGVFLQTAATDGNCLVFLLKFQRTTCPPISPFLFRRSTNT